MTLAEKQGLLAECLAALVAKFATPVGTTPRVGSYRLRLGWALDPPDSPGTVAETGEPLRSAGSLHRAGLAVDVLLDRWDGHRWVYLRKTAEYACLGIYWESLHELTEWGGAGQRGDGNHFSIGHGGRW